MDFLGLFGKLYICLEVDLFSWLEVTKVPVPRRREGEREPAENFRALKLMESGREDPLKVL